MVRRIAIFVLLVMSASMTGCSWFGGSNQARSPYSLIRSSDGAIVVWNQPQTHFTVSVSSHSLSQMHDEPGLAINVNGRVLKINTIDTDMIRSHGYKEPDMLRAHMRWELSHWAEYLKQSMKGKSLKRFNDRTGATLIWQLNWTPEIAERVNSDASDLYYATTVVGPRVVAMALTVPQWDDPNKALTFLTTVAKSLRRYDGPVDAGLIHGAVEANN